MKVRDVMTRRVETVDPRVTVADAAEKMRALNVGALPVCDDVRLAGMVTDRDLAVRALADGKNPGTTQVRDVMTPKIVYCFDDESTEDAARRMVDAGVRRLPVLDRGRQLVGIVSVDDLAALAGEAVEVGRVTRRVIRKRQLAVRALRSPIAWLSLLGVADGLWALLAPRAWGRFWENGLHRIACRRRGPALFGGFEILSSALMLRSAVMP
jgi:CBS domain-containing protein